MKYLFIGNSHTYFNDMPHLFAQLAQTEDNDVHVTMLTRGGMGFPYHLSNEEAPFNIRYGNYDYVILQHVAHPMGPIEDMFDAGRQLIAMAQQAGAKPLLYMTWTERGNEAFQPEMTSRYRRLAQETGAGIIPAGEVWQAVRKALPQIDLYWKDGQHASPAGSKLVAAAVFATIFNQLPPAESAEDRVIAKLALELSRKENALPEN